MPQLITFLTFNNQAEEAARFYASIFPNSRITKVSHYPDLGPNFPFKPGTVMTVEFELNGRPFVALNGGPSFNFSTGFSIYVECDTQEEVDRYWNALLQGGGKEVACGWLTDKFGMSWQVTPKLLMDAVTNPNKERAAKAMQAMMTMVKIDVEGIRQALAD